MYIYVFPFPIIGIIDGNLAAFKTEEYLKAHPKSGQYSGKMWSKGYKDPNVPSQKEYTSGPSTRGQWNNVNTNVIR